MRATLVLPHDLGPYRLHALLGSGGMGDVFRAHDQRLDRDVAVKHLRATHADAAPQLRREARAAARLNHPAIVQVFDVIEGPDDNWIVMELVEGVTIAELLESKRCDVEMAIQLGEQIADGLSEAHTSGLVHGDLKAENIMMTPARRAKILDFGLALSLDTADDSGAKSAGGTYRTMAPEQARGLPVDARSDLFSLGVLLYEMATGVSPFHAPSREETLARICTHHQMPADQRNEHVPPALARLIDQLLDKSPEQRPRHARRVAVALAGLRAELETHDASTQSVSSGWRRMETALPLPPSASSDAEGEPSASRFRRSGWLVAAIIVMLGAIIAIWSLAPSTRTPTTETVTTTPFARYQDGMAHIERFDIEGNLDRAVTILEALVADHPDYASAHAGLALSYWRLAREHDDESWLERALPIAERAVALDEHLATSHTSHGLVLLDLGRAEEARSAFEHALTLAPEHAEAHRGLGELAQYRGDLDAAIGHLRRAVAVAPDNRRFHDKLGTLYYLNSDYDEAAAAFEQSIATAPDAEFGYRNLAAVRYVQGRLDEAATLLQRALEIRPKAAVYSNLGTLLFAQGRYAEAIEPYRKAVALEVGGAGDALMWGNLGDAYRWTPGHEVDAHNAFARAVELIQEDLVTRPDDPHLHSQLALYLAKGGECSAAEAAAEQVAAHGDPAGRFAFRLAIAHHVCGRVEEALSQLDHALSAGFSRTTIEDEIELRTLRELPGYQALAKS
ncbi:MAG: protein kinase [Acidobacteriota bacterium]